MNVSDFFKVNALHRDLAQKYHTYLPRIEKTWRASSRSQREQYLKGSDHARYLPEPEWNIDDLVGDSEYILDLLAHRAIKSLEEQVYLGMNEGAGDYDLAQYEDPDEYWPSYFGKDCVYLSAEHYGEIINVSYECDDEALERFDKDVKAGVLIPMIHAGPIIRRQVFFLHCLDAVVENILNGKSQQKRLSWGKKSIRGSNAHSSKPTLHDLIACAEGHKTYHEEHLALLRSDPTVLYKSAKDQTLGRVEPVHNEYVVMDPNTPDYTVWRDFFEVVRTSVRSVALWKSMSALLRIMDKFSNEELRKEKALKEIRSMCDLQFTKARRSAQAHVENGIDSTWSKREIDEDDSWYSPDLRGDLLVTDRHLHYLLWLLDTRVDITTAVYQLEKLDQFYKLHPHVRERLSHRECHVLQEMCAVVAFMEDLRLAFPPKDHSCDTLKVNSSQDTDLGPELFASGLMQIHIELLEAGQGILQQAFTASLDDLLEPAVASKMLDLLDTVVKDKMGTSLDTLYQDQVEEMVRTLELSKRVGHAIRMFWLDRCECQNPVQKAESRRRRDERRGSQSPVEPEVLASKSNEGNELDPFAKKAVVRSETAKRLMVLFDRSQPHDAT
ncbi:hypothetical protein ACLX1H_005034 [Fusarium chlamydosporum]